MLHSYVWLYNQRLPNKSWAASLEIWLKVGDGP